jgi:hypothetical protein
VQNVRTRRQRGGTLYYGWIITELQAAGATSLRAIAAALNERRIKTPRGDGEWQAVQVSRRWRAAVERPAQLRSRTALPPLLGAIGGDATLPRQSLRIDAQTYCAKDEKRQCNCKKDNVPIHVILLFGAPEPAAEWVHFTTSWQACMPGKLPTCITSRR